MIGYSSNFQNFGLLVLRLGIGAAFILHGLPKLAGGPELWAQLGAATGAAGIHFLPAFWGFMAAFAEFFGGVCLIAGLFTRVFSVLLTATMAVAATMHLSKGDDFTVASHAIEMGVVFLSLMFMGPGRISLDWLLFRKKD
jgi:putative oxidoreductase